MKFKTKLARFVHETTTCPFVDQNREYRAAAEGEPGIGKKKKVESIKGNSAKQKGKSRSKGKGKVGAQIKVRKESKGNVGKSKGKNKRKGAAAMAVKAHQA